MSIFTEIRRSFPSRLKDSEVESQWMQPTKLVGSIIWKKSTLETTRRQQKHKEYDSSIYFEERGALVIPTIFVSIDDDVP